MEQHDYVRGMWSWPLPVLMITACLVPPALSTASRSCFELREIATLLWLVCRSEWICCFGHPVSHVLLVTPDAATNTQAS